MTNSQQKLRILRLINSLDVGGAEAMLTRLGTGMDRERFDNHVITLLAPGPLAEDLRDANIDVEGLGVRRGFFNPAILSRLRRRMADLDIHRRSSSTWAETVGRSSASGPGRES